MSQCHCDVSHLLSIPASAFSPVGHKLQPVSHLRVWHVLHLKHKLAVNAQEPTLGSRLDPLTILTSSLASWVMGTSQAVPTL